MSEKGGTIPFASGTAHPSESPPERAPGTQPLGSLPASAGTETLEAIRDVPADAHIDEPAPLPELTPLANEERVGNYRVLSPLGEGGMATVYLAEHTQTGVRVALKRVKDGAKNDPDFVQRFLREVRTASKLDHAHVCKVFEGGDDGKHVYMAVELIDGGDVDALLRKMGGKLPAAVATQIVCELLEALDHAHALGLVHRDIKPANVMLTSAGVTKLVDFGIAKSNTEQKLTATGLVIGTPAYMSPEQARGQPLDARSDLFSVGVMLVEMLTGVNPFMAETATATVMKILLERAPPLFAIEPSAPGVLGRVCAGLLEPDLARRYPSARAALDDLRAYRQLVEQQHPQLLARCLSDPKATAREVLTAQAKLEIDRAADLTDLGEIGMGAAALALVRAVRIAPDAQVAEMLLKELCQRAGFNLAPSDKRLSDLEAEIARAPTQPAMLKRAADLHAIVKNPPGQAHWLARYLQAQPRDALAETQYVSIVSGPPPKGATARVKLSTREIVDGIKTGGWKAAASATESFTSVRRSPPTESAPVRARAPIPQTLNSGTGGPGVVVMSVREESSGLGKIAAGVAMVIVLGGGGLSLMKWTAQETKRSAQKSFDDTAHLMNSEPGEIRNTAAQLELARKHLAEGAALDALQAAEVVLSSKPSMTDAADAYLIKAKARARDNDDMQALRELDSYFRVAPPGHSGAEEAKALHARLKR